MATLPLCALALAACTAQDAGPNGSDAMSPEEAVLANPVLLSSPAFLREFEDRTLALGKPVEQVALRSCALMSLSDAEKQIVIGALQDGGSAKMDEGRQIALAAMERPETQSCIPGKIAELKARA